MTVHRSNPFSTKFVRPGAIEFEFSGEDSIDSIIERFDRSSGSMQIIGPHGVGKSSLLYALRSRWESAGLQVEHVELHDGQRRLTRQTRASIAQALSAPHGRRLLVDGCEQLRWWNRLALLRVCRRHDLRLLVTAHNTLGLPTLIELTPSLDMFCRVVARLQAKNELQLATEEMRAAFDRNNGDFREALFELYDVWEDQARSSQFPS